MATELIKYKYTVDGNEAEKTLGKLEGNFNRLGKVVVGFGASAGILATVGFKAADMASDLNEAKNVVQVAFGDMSDEVIRWSETSVQKMGISQTEALKTAGVYGNMSTSMGLNTKEAYKMATSLTQLSGDMASFYNISQDQAATALKGIFTGETESLKELGIMIDTTSLEQYGYNDSMTAAEKIQIRYKAVMEATKNAQGDYARTLPAMANQTRLLQQNFIQLVTIIGSKLQPVVNNIIRTLNNDFAAAIALASGNTDGLTKSQQAIYEKMQKIIPIIITAAKVVGVLAVAYAAFSVTMAVVEGVVAAATVAQTLWTIATGAQTVAQLGLDAALLPFIAIVVGIIAIVISAIVVFTHWADITDYVKQKWTDLKTFLAQWATDTYNGFVTWLTNTGQAIVAWGQSVKELIVKILTLIYNDIKQWAVTVITLVVVWAKAIYSVMTMPFTLAYAVISGALTIIFNEVKLIFTNIYNTIINIMNEIKTGIAGVWQSIKLIFSSVLGLIHGIVTINMTEIKSSISGIMNGIKGVFSSVWGAIKGVFTSALDGIKGIVTDSITNVKDTVTTKMAEVKTAFDNSLALIKTAFSTTFQAIYDNTIGKLVSLKDSITGWASGIGDSISSGISAINPFDNKSLQLTPQYFGGTGSSGGVYDNRTNVTYNINSTARNMTTREMHKQSQAARMRGAGKNVR